jgi:MinD-like ATPase involved in chromosome partitioning or flagellar assembly/tetratricopeptide (TPR) repeat protein
MQVITFYSFKGGVGRTQLLLNVACIVAARGKNVALVDMDIHAPGLSFMRCLRPDDGKAPQSGLIDFFETAVEAAGQPEAEIADLTACAYEPPEIRTKLRARAKDAGNLWLIPCADFHGTGTPEQARTAYLERLDALSPRLQRLAARSRAHAMSAGHTHQNPILSEMEEQLADLSGDRGTPDFLFIDARTGFTEISDMILCHGASHLVLVSGLNEQNQTGLDLTLSELSRRGDDGWRQELSIALSLIPWGEEQAVQEAVQRIKDMLRRHSGAEASLFGEEGTRDPFRIPYHPRLAVTDSPIVLDFPESPLSQVYEECADHLAPEVRRGEVLPFLTRIPLEERKARKQPSSDRPSIFAGRAPWHLYVKPQRVNAVREALFPPAKVSEGVTADAFINAVWNDLDKDAEAKAALLLSIPSLSSFQLSETVKALTQNRHFTEKFHGIFGFSLNDTLGLRWCEWRQVLLRCGVDAGDLWSIPEALPRINPAPGALNHGRFWTELASAMRMADDPAWLEVLRQGYPRLKDDPDFVIAAAEMLHLARKTTDAIAWLRTLLSFGDERITLPQLGQLHYQLGECLRFANDQHSARLELRRALDLYTTAKNDLGQANAHYSLGHVSLREDDLAGARTHYSHALELYNAANSTLGQANVQSALGGITLREDDLAGARKYYSHASELYTAANATLGQANVQSSIGGIALQENDLAGAHTHLSHSLDLYTSAKDVVGQANAHHSLGGIALRRCDLPGARTHYSRALELYTAASSTLGQGNAHRSLGDVALREADLAGARTHLIRALDVYTAAKNTISQASAQRSLGDVALREDDLPAARTHYTRALELHNVAKSTLGQANDHKGLAECVLRENQWDAAREALEACLVRYTSLNEQEGLHETQLLLAEAWHGIGDAIKAADLIAEVVKWAKLRGFKLLQRDALELKQKLFPT